MSSSSGGEQDDQKCSGRQKDLENMVKPITQKFTWVQAAHSVFPGILPGGEDGASAGARTVEAGARTVEADRHRLSRRQLRMCNVALRRNVQRLGTSVCATEHNAKMYTTCNQRMTVTVSRHRTTYEHRC